MSAKVVLRLYGSILAELARRKILTTNDSPIGGYGESVARAFGGERQRNSSTGFDVLLPDGLRLQVKTRWLPLVGGLRQLSAIRKLESRGFDYVIAVLLDKNFDVAEAYQISHAAVGRLATFAAHTNSQKRLKLAKRLLRPDGVLIVMIDEHEIHHLGMLLEHVFKDAYRQMVSIVVDPKGVTQERFSRVEEYALAVSWARARSEASVTTSSRR